MTRDTLIRLEALLQADDRAGALAAAAQILADGSLTVERRAETLRMRSIVHERAGRTADALADLRAAFSLRPGDARLANEVGLLSTDVGDRAGALAAFRQAIALDPGYARAHGNLGAILRETGDLAGAADAFAAAVRVNRDYALGWANLGATLRDLGRRSDAIAALERALAIDARQRVALLALAAVRRSEGAIDAAADLFARALEVDPRDASAWLQLAGTLAERDDLAQARQACARALELDPSMLRAFLGRHLQLPMVVPSEAALALARAEYSNGLRQVEAGLPALAAPLAAERTLDELRWINWLLPYHGEDEKPLQARYAAAVGAALASKAPQWRAPIAPRERGGRPIRVAFVSAFFRDGTVGRYFEHWITDLPRDAFEVLVYQLNPGSDDLTARLAARADRYLRCPVWRPSQVAERIRADAPDVVVYPELGLEATTFALAALRLAPLQCAAWGHPVTTGHATIDVFFSSDAMEPADGADHYTERLVRLPGIGTRYAKPAVPEGATRARFGLPAEAPLFLCPQSHYKIHPENDALFARVLAATPGSRLVLFDGRHPRLTGVYLGRLHATLAAAGVARDRLAVLPQCPHDDYMRINAVCDAMLDTLRWSGGNTSLDALASGLPIVTLPGRYMRGRQSAGMLRLLECGEVVARDEDDYVAIARRLAQDRPWRDALAARIVAHAERVFDVTAPVDAFAAFLRANA